MVLVKVKEVIDREHTNVWCRDLPLRPLTEAPPPPEVDVTPTGQMGTGR